MNRRLRPELAPPPPQCERCGELCEDSPIKRFSVTGERLCFECAEREEDDISGRDEAGFSDFFGDDE